MRLFFWLLYKLVRPNIPISSALATWIISQACDAEFDASVAASASIAISTIGASVYHYGAQNKVYTRKSENLKLKQPKFVMGIGFMIFIFSVIMALLSLPIMCAGICIFNTGAIAAYSKTLSKHFRTKNLTMAIISTTPVLIGWQAGQFTHPIVFCAIFLAAISNLSREMIKDVLDIKANQGHRVTLPMYLDPETVLVIAGVLLIVTTVVPFFFLPFTESMLQQSMVLASAAVFLLTAGWLIVYKVPGRTQTAINAGLLLAVAALLR